MVRKFSLFLLLISILSFSMGTMVFAEAKKPSIQAKANYVIDYSSGAILTEDNGNTELALASLTKLMTVLIVLDQISAGRLHWSDIVTVSKKAEAVNESEIRLIAGEKITIKELVTGMMVQSANDAAYALAEKVSGTESKFVALMNQKAKQLGLTKTHFYTSNGLIYKSTSGKVYNNYMSAADIAHLTRILVATHPEIYTFSKITHYTFHKGTKREMKVTNTNLMLPTLAYGYKGVDGLKTGYTSAAGYCYTGTVQRNNFRLIAVVLGSSSVSKRFSDTKKLYDYIYSIYTPRKVLEAGKPISSYKTITIQGHRGPVTIAPLRNLTVPLRNGQERSYTYHIVIYSNLKAPMKKGTAVGYVQVYYKGKAVAGTPPISLVTSSNVTKN
ncbi:D-alanyl-D-alanine carboxypeptidase [Shimazuella sp. AN120528]|uniref:D-alanyl-D-alanine carboxypeptidase family protein n=1 Tax=Shimazuella soli TaxID=1892854 RepID=UPI001F10215E|nr:D-alanyl-D-alanine carboxypeptidase family protein [Shimazuella soli]MCH5584987.1 D-alanyl-D-alanine carboxypeptidase [Shimazuella soli]